MKTLILFFILGNFFVENDEKKVAAVIFFEEQIFDFGDVFRGEKVEHTFTFENKGASPLIISNVLTECGCTATDWPEDPLLPGEEGDITVVFNTSGKSGYQKKNIRVVANIKERYTTLQITANVLPKKGS